MLEKDLYSKLVCYRFVAWITGVGIFSFYPRLAQDDRLQ